MLTQIEVESIIDINTEIALVIPIFGATPKDSLLIRKITGLSPPDINLFIGDYARDGGIYQGRRVGNRNIVIIFDLNPNPALGETISGLREMLYKAFVDPLVDADYIKINLRDDENRVRYLVGYTEKFETEIFDVETMAQISIICPDPYLRDEIKTVLTDVNGWTTVPFTYEGTAETGFEVEILVTTSTAVLTLENNGKTMVITRSFSVGDVVNVNTNRGSRSLTVSPTWSSIVTYVPDDIVYYSGILYYASALVSPANLNKIPSSSPTYWSVLSGSTPSGKKPTSILASLSPTSPWLELHSQDNTMKIYGATSANLIAAIRSLEYTQSYWGV